MRTNLADVAKAFIAKGKHGYAIATVAVYALLAATATVASISNLPEIVTAIRGKPPPAIHER